MSIIRRLWAAAGLLALIFTGSVGTGYFVLRDLLAVKAEADAATIAMRNHVEIDMMHDALRASFYAALNAAHSSDKVAADAVASELVEYSNWVDRLVDANEKLPLERKIRQQIMASDAAMRDYAKETDRLAKIALSDPASAQQMIPSFQKTFGQLETANERTSDMLQSHLSARSDRVRNRLSQLQTLALLSFLAIAAAFFTFIFYLQSKIVAPVMRVTKALADGDALDMADCDREDEIGRLANSVADFTAAAEARREAENRIAEAERSAKQARETADRQAKEAADAERRRALLSTAEALERQLKHLSDAVVQTSTELKTVATNLSSSALISRDEAMSTSAAAAQTLDGVNAIVDATDELGTSVSEINASIAPMIDASYHVEQLADEATTRMVTLNQAAEKVGSITSLISAIASQTNLLALNATIEAARAGEAGQGFAVVANEVKQLAQQTANATAEIDVQIGDIALAAGDMGNSISGMADAVAKLGASTTQIATTAEQQMAATAQIGTTIQQAATGTEIMRSNLGRVDDQAKITAANAELVEKAADSLKANIGALSQAISDFIEDAKRAA